MTLTSTVYTSNGDKIVETPCKAVVVNENVLGFFVEKYPEYVYILSASIIKGAFRGNGHSLYLWKEDNVRPATEKDFEDFRVSLDRWRPNSLN